jgi:hypothetical protein
MSSRTQPLFLYVGKSGDLKPPPQPRVLRESTMTISAEQETWNAWIAKHRVAEKVLNARLRVIGIAVVVVLLVLGTVYIARG